LAKSRIYVPGNFALQVKRSSTGLGLFAKEKIKRNTCIIEYVGRTLNEDEKYTSRSKYLFGVTAKKTIDGSIRSNIARYLNHSCIPSCETDVHAGRIYVFSLRTIEPSEELVFDYGKEYFDAYIQPLGCRCRKCSPVELAQQLRDNLKTVLQT
jgi:hypothetical protein